MQHRILKKKPTKKTTTKKTPKSGGRRQGKAAERWGQEHHCPVVYVSGENERIWAPFGEKSENRAREMFPSSFRAVAGGDRTSGARVPSSPQDGAAVLLDPAEAGTPCSPRTPSPASLYVGQWYNASRWGSGSSTHPKHLENTFPKSRFGSPVLWGN